MSVICRLVYFSETEVDVSYVNHYPAHPSSVFVRKLKVFVEHIEHSKDFIIISSFIYFSLFMLFISFCLQFHMSLFFVSSAKQKRLSDYSVGVTRSVGGIVVAVVVVVVCVVSVEQLNLLAYIQFG